MIAFRVGRHPSPAFTVMDDRYQCGVRLHEMRMKKDGRMPDYALAERHQILRGAEGAGR
jgi:hypothetical protein